MEKAELVERLKGYEWNDVEFKRAQRGVPESAYETVSAFSNTEGGWLVFGIRDSVPADTRSSVSWRSTRSRTTSSASCVPVRS